MTPIIPAFTVSERSLITADNDRGFTPIGLNPANELAPWRDTIRQCGAVFLNRAFGMSEKGYRTHDLEVNGRRLTAGEYLDEYEAQCCFAAAGRA